MNQSVGVKSPDTTLENGRKRKIILRQLDKLLDHDKNSPSANPIEDPGSVSNADKNSESYRRWVDECWNTKDPVYEIIGVEFEDEPEADKQPQEQETEGQFPERDSLEDDESDTNESTSTTISIWDSDEFDQTEDLTSVDDDCSDSGENKENQGENDDEEKNEREGEKDDNSLEEEDSWDILETVDPPPPPLKWNCFICESAPAFPDYKSFKTHFFKEHHQLETCPECHEWSKNVFQHYVTVHLRRVICDACDLAFRESSTDFQIHIFEKHSQRSAVFIHDHGELRCPICDISFVNFKAFEGHFTTSARHTKVALQCAIGKCRVMFTKNSYWGSLKLHSMDHLFHNHLSCRFSCAFPLCQFTSPSPFGVFVHGQQNHCPEICRQFHYEKYMKCYREEAKQRMAWCDICGLRFDSEGSMEVHRNFEHFLEKEGEWEELN